MPPSFPTSAHLRDPVSQLGCSSSKVVAIITCHSCHTISGLLVDVMTGSNAVKMRSLVLSLWSDCVLGGEQRRPLTWAEAVPGK